MGCAAPLKSKFRGKNKKANETWHGNVREQRAPSTLFYFIFFVRFFAARTSAANKINEAIISLYIFRHFRLVVCFVSPTKLCNKTTWNQWRRRPEDCIRLFREPHGWFVDFEYQTTLMGMCKQWIACTYYFMNFNKSSSSASDGGSNDSGRDEFFGRLRKSFRYYGRTSGSSPLSPTVLFDSVAVDVVFSPSRERKEEWKKLSRSEQQHNVIEDYFIFVGGKNGIVSLQRASRFIAFHTRYQQSRAEQPAKCMRSDDSFSLFVAVVCGTQRMNLRDFSHERCQRERDVRGGAGENGPRRGKKLQ